MPGPRLAHNVFFKLKDNSWAKVQELIDACVPALLKELAEFAEEVQP